MKKEKKITFIGWLRREIGIIAVLTFFSSVSIGQISISPFYSMSYEKKDPGTTKDRMGKGIALDYDLGKSCGIGLQMRDYELWRVGSSLSAVVPLRTYSLRFYLCQSAEYQSKWFFAPKAGILAGIGTAADNQSGMMQDLEVLPHPYFFGVFIQMGGGVKLSPKFQLSAFLKTEAVAGMVRNRAAINENGSTSGTLSSGLTMTYVFQKKIKTKKFELR